MENQEPDRAEMKPTLSQAMEIILDNILDARMISGKFALIRSETINIPLEHRIQFSILGGSIQFRFVESKEFKLTIDSSPEGRTLTIDLEYRAMDALQSGGFGSPEFIEIISEPTVAVTFHGLLSPKTVMLNVNFWVLESEFDQAMEEGGDGE